MNSNIAGWRNLHAKGRYYDTHPNYVKRDGRIDTDDLVIIAGFLLNPAWNVAVIGSGYGREIAMIAPYVRRVYAIDVRETFPYLRAFLGKKEITNFVEVDAENWRDGIKDPIDFVYSVVTFQHLTRDLVEDYMAGFSVFLADNARAIVQFSESPTGTFDADDRPVEPNVKWTVPEIRDLLTRTGYDVIEIKTVSGVGGTRVTRPWKWHWVFFRKKNEGEKP